METYVLKRGPYKALTLRLRRTDGSLRVSAPWFVSRAAIDQFVAERAAWIADQRRGLPDLTGPVESVAVWGQRLPVVVKSPGSLPRVVVEAGKVVLRVPASWTPEQHRRVLDQWEKERVREAVAERLPFWASRLGLKVDRWTVKRLRSRWGSCRPATRSLVFNAQLGSLPDECLDHVIVHELVHLWEPSHNARFHALLNQWYPESDSVKRWLRAGGVPIEADVSQAPRATRAEETEPQSPRG